MCLQGDGENMEFVTGLIAGVVLFGVFLCLLYVGYQMGKKERTQPPEKDEEKLRKAAKMQEDFVSLMNYDVNTALQRKKVR